MPMKFFYNEFIDLNSEIYWEKHIATITNLELIEYAGDIKDFPYDVFPLYECKVEYTFDFKNKNYIGNTISSELGIKGLEINKDFYKKLYNSKKIFIWANKRNLKQSSITKKSILTERLFSSIGMFLLPLSILNLIRIRRKNDNRTLINRLEIYNDR